MKTPNRLKLLLAMITPLLLAIAPGEMAPEFALKNQNGKVIRLSEQRGKFVVLYFYPKDETPGCTREACSFRDEYAQLKKLNAVILGVSAQDEQSHSKFIAHHQLPFDLLVDTDGATAKAYGIGKIPLLGLIKRKSVLIGTEGKVIRFYDDVDPQKHVQEVIQDLQKAASSR